MTDYLPAADIKSACLDEFLESCFSGKHYTLCAATQSCVLKLWKDLECSEKQYIIKLPVCRGIILTH